MYKLKGWNLRKLVYLTRRLFLSKQFKYLDKSLKDNIK